MSRMAIWRQWFGVACSFSAKVYNSSLGRLRRETCGNGSGSSNGSGQPVGALQTDNTGAQRDIEEERRRERPSLAHLLATCSRRNSGDFRPACRNACALHGARGVEVQGNAPPKNKRADEEPQ